jgi:uncharacterized protein
MSPAETTPAAEPPAPDRTEQVDTPSGPARISWHTARRPRSVLALGHGAGGGIQARDLAALARVLPAAGASVALVEQPWRVAGKKLAPAPATLDAAWTALWPALARPGGGGPPVVAGGRSAGARVACRTAERLGAAAVLTLAFPLHPPGRPASSRAAELTGAGAVLPLLAVQGGNDPFGRPAEFPPGLFSAGLPSSRRPSLTAVEVPYADHGFAVPKRAPVTQEAALAVLTEAVTDWLAGLGLATGPGGGRTGSRTGGAARRR